MTEDKYEMAVKTEEIAVGYGVPRSKLLELGRMYFEAGQRDGLTTYATAVTNALHSRVV